MAVAIQDLCSTLGARCAVLLALSRGEAPALVERSSRGMAEDLATLDRIAPVLADGSGDGRPRWSEIDNDGHDGALLLPLNAPFATRTSAICFLFQQGDAMTRRRVGRLLEGLAPAVTAYVRLWQRSRALLRRQSAMSAVLNSAETALVVVGEHARILFANVAARALLSTGDGLTEYHGTLRATHLADGVNLQAALSHASMGDIRQGHGHGLRGAPLISFRRDKAPALIALVLPATDGTPGAGEATAIVCVTEPGVDGQSVASLCRLYGLSPVETRLVCSLAEGTSLSAAAQAMRIKEQTARSYLKQIFIKTSTRRQSELIVLILSSLVRMKAAAGQQPLTGAGGEQALATTG